MLFALFFFFRDGDEIMSRLRRVLPFDPSFREGRIRETADLIRASISSGLIVALVQGTIGGITFALLGLGAPIFWGVTMAFFSLLPLGAWIVWFPVALWLLLTGEIARGVALATIGAGGISMIDNFLRPMLLAGRTADERAARLHQPPWRHFRIRPDWSRARPRHHGRRDQLRRCICDRTQGVDGH